MIHSLYCCTCLQHPWMHHLFDICKFPTFRFKMPNSFVFTRGFWIDWSLFWLASSACLMPPSVSVISENLSLTHQSASKWLYFGDFYLVILASKITVDGDCSHKIKRHLFLGRKTMTDLDSILKSTDMTLLAKIHLVKAMVFPVVMYGCESWIIKTVQRIDAFELWHWKRFLRVPWTARRSSPSPS